MSSNQSTVLAVDPGCRELGVAVLRGSELLFYGVKSITNRKNPQTILETVSSHVRNLIKKHRPDYLAVEKIAVKQHSSYAFLAVAAEQIKATARESNLPVYEYAPKDVRKRLCRTARATRRETAEILAARYPELNCYYLRNAKWERDYYGNLFDAVAVSVVCEEDLKESETLNGREIDNS